MEVAAKYILMASTVDDLIDKDDSSKRGGIREIHSIGGFCD